MEFFCSTLDLSCPVKSNKLNSLILNEKLNEYKNYSANSELVRWERYSKEIIGKRTSNDREKSDYNTCLQEESKYNSTLQ